MIIDRDLNAAKNLLDKVHSSYNDRKVNKPHVVCDTIGWRISFPVIFMEHCRMCIGLAEPESTPVDMTALPRFLQETRHPAWMNQEVKEVS